MSDNNDWKIENQILNVDKMNNNEMKNWEVKSGSLIEEEKNGFAMIKG